MALNLTLVVLLLAFGVSSIAQASREFMLLGENRYGRDSSSSSSSGLASSAALDPTEFFYQLFGSSGSSGGGTGGGLQNVRQMIPQPVRNILNQTPTSFGQMGNQMDGMLSSGYDQVNRRVKQTQQVLSDFDDGERLLLQMYEMIQNPEEMCRQLANQALSPALKFAMEQSQNAMKTAQSAVSSATSMSPSSMASQAMEPANSLLNRFTQLGKK